MTQIDQCKILWALTLKVQPRVRRKYELHMALGTKIKKKHAGKQVCTEILQNFQPLNCHLSEISWKHGSAEENF